MPWSQTRGEAGITLPITVLPVLTSTILKVSSFPSRQLRGSIPLTFRLTAYLLAVRRLKLGVTTQSPRTRYPVAGQPSGTGLPPAGLHDLARPHGYTVPLIHTTDMNVPGWKLHQLSTGHWSIWVNGNWRMTFDFDGEDAVLIDYPDYH